MAVDVGTGQLLPRLAADNRVTVRDGVNARDLRASGITGPYPLIVADVSFISLTLIIPSLAPVLAQPEGIFVALIKPQFEVGAGNLGSGGIVRDPRSTRFRRRQRHRCRRPPGFAAARFNRKPDHRAATATSNFSQCFAFQAKISSYAPSNYRGSRRNHHVSFGRPVRRRHAHRLRGPQRRHTHQSGTRWMPCSALKVLERRLRSPMSPERLRKERLPHCAKRWRNSPGTRRLNHCVCAPMLARAHEMIPDQPSARAALEMALYDLWGQSNGLPLWHPLRRGAGALNRRSNHPNRQRPRSGESKRSEPGSAASGT